MLFRSEAPCSEVREYDGEGNLVGTHGGESEAALIWRVSSLSQLVAPPSCPDWMEGQMCHPSVYSS